MDARRTAIVRDLDRWTPILLLLGAALAVRALIAIVLVPESGFQSDTLTFQRWARDLASAGPPAFYDPGSGHYASYPPAFMFLLWAVGLAGPGWATISGAADGVAALIKVPFVLGDIACGAAVYLLARHVTSERGALVAAAVFLFDPSVIVTSTIWGQNDSVATFPVVLGAWLLARGATEGAAASAVTAALVKFQYGILVPVVAVVALRRHLREPARLATTALAVAVALLVILVPFRLGLYDPADPAHSLFHRLGEAAGVWTDPTLSAFNIWMNPVTGLFAQGPDPTRLPGGDAIVLLSLGSLQVTAFQIGVGLFALAAVPALGLLLRRDDAPALVFSTFVIACAFFFLLTRIHERYLFPALALGSVLAVGGRWWAALRVALSTLLFLNLWWIYTKDGYPGLPGGDLFEAVFTPDSIHLFSLAGSLLMAAIVVAAYVELIRPGSVVPPAMGRSSAAAEHT